MMPRILHQIWPGPDPIPERLAYLMARNVKYCEDHGYEHWFWTLTESGAIALKIGTRYRLVDLLVEKLADIRMFTMLADPKLHPVMKGDILRFTIDYLYGGYYADLDALVCNLQDSFLELPYVCGYERERGGHGRPGCEQKPICTGFFGAPQWSPVNSAMADHILAGYDKMRTTGKYPADMWDVIALTVDPLVKICERFGVKPFPMEYFFPYPIPEAVPPFSIHHYAGTEPGGWTFDYCKNEDCPTCKEKDICKISRAGRR
jgi:hypothetical protein